MRTHQDRRAVPTKAFTRQERLVVTTAQTLFALRVLTVNAFPDKDTKEMWTNQSYGEAYGTVTSTYFQLIS